MEIEVTQEHIDRGQPHCGESCPVALAISDIVNEDAWVDLDEVGFFSVEEDDFIDIPTPSVVKEFITAFDAGRPVTPFRFELEI